MSTTPMRRTTAAVLAAGVLALAGCASDLPGSSAGEETDYPTRAIDLVLPFGAGGSTDIAARAMAEALSTELGQPFNATNQTGAQQVTAVSNVISSSGDGYTLLADGAGSSTIHRTMAVIAQEDSPASAAALDGRALELHRKSVASPSIGLEAAV